MQPASAPATPTSAPPIAMQTDDKSQTQVCYVYLWYLFFNTGVSEHLLYTAPNINQAQPLLHSLHPPFFMFLLLLVCSHYHQLTTS